MEIIIGRQGNQKTPITDPSVSRKHCKVTINPDGTYTIENLSDYGTKVNGTSIIRTTVTLDSVLELGPSYKAKLKDLIGFPQQFRESHDNFRSNSVNGPKPQPSPTPEPKPKVMTYNISHLRHVWEDYNNKNIEAAEKQRKINLTRTGLGIFTMCAMPTIFFLGPVGLAGLGYALTGIGIVGNIYSFFGLKNSESTAEKQRRQEEFDDAWVCPNPSCGKTLLAKNYKMLVKNHQSCPYCKSKYVEK